MKSPKSVREPIQAYLDETERGWLDAIAEREGISRSEALRRSIRQYHQAGAAPTSPLLAIVDAALTEPGLSTGPGDIATRHDAHLADAYLPSAQRAADAAMLRAHTTSGKRAAGTTPKRRSSR